MCNMKNRIWIISNIQMLILCIQLIAQPAMDLIFPDGQPHRICLSSDSKHMSLNWEVLIAWCLGSLTSY